MNKLFYFVAFVLFLFVFFFAIFAVYEEKFFIIGSRAEIVDISPYNTYAFTAPVCAKADLNEKIRAYVFCINNRGFGVPHQKVQVFNFEQFQVEVIQGITDSSGKAIFDIASDKKGFYESQVMCGDTKIIAPIKLCFR